MSWRTVVIQSHVKLSYKNDFMIVRGDEVKMIHLSEINTVIIDSTQVSLTSYLLCEFVKRKIKVIFCDEKRNPNDIEQCPIGCETCAGDCFYYDEDLN